MDWHLAIVKVGETQKLQRVFTGTIRSTTLSSCGYFKSRRALDECKANRLLIWMHAHTQEHLNFPALLASDTHPSVDRAWAAARKGTSLDDCLHAAYGREEEMHDEVRKWVGG